MKSPHVCVDTILIKFLKTKTEFIDLRRIIYSILYRIGFDKSKASKGDQQLLTMVQCYPQLRIGEIWQDLKYSLESSNVRVTQEDIFFIESNIQEFQKIVDGCVKVQECTAKENRKIQEEELNKFYDLLKNQKKYVR